MTSCAHCNRFLAPLVHHSYNPAIVATVAPQICSCSSPPRGTPTMMLGLSHQRLSNASSTTSTFSRRPLQARSSPTELCSSRSPHPRQSRPCCASPQDSETSDRQQQQPSSSSDSSLSAAPSKQTNALIAGGAALIGVGLFAYTRLSVGPATLATLQQVSLPYEEALTNGKPTLLEFYADWCEICRSTAPDVYQVQHLTSSPSQCRFP